MTLMEPKPKPQVVRHRERIDLMGMPIDVVTEREAIDIIMDGVLAGKGGSVITPNLDQMRRYYVDLTVRPLFERAHLVVADGMPLVWASRLQGTALPERVPGSGMILSLTKAAAEQGRSVYLLGGNPGAAAGAAAKLLELFPGIKIAGTCCPEIGFEKDRPRVRVIEQELLEKQPDIVYVGLGFPKQDRLIAHLRTVLPQAWFLGIGVSFRFITGEVKRAPRWMQAIGLEWIHRMVQEPGRLFRRYIIEDLPFAGRLFWSSFRALGHARIQRK